MNNIFQNAHFGKSYRTRDGRKAIYWMYDPLCCMYKTIIDNEVLNLVYSNGKICSNAELGKDIVAEWQEEINEEELDKLAEHEYPYEYYTSLYGEEEAEYKDDLREAFKAGYRAAKNENT